MKIRKYAVSVQWGAGHHYFLHFYATQEEAQVAAERHLQMLKQRQNKRGAKPHSMVWELVSDSVIVTPK